MGPDGGDDPESEEFEAAEEECQPILEEARPDIQLSPEEQAEMQDKLTPWPSACAPAATTCPTRRSPTTAG